MRTQPYITNCNNTCECASHSKGPMNWASLRFELQPKSGKRVAVIGGGNVATDNARSARRLGAEVVDMVYRRTQEEMPARDDEVQGCVEEQVNLRFLLAPKKIELNDSGSSRLRITYVKMELGEPDASGRRRPMEVAGSEFSEDVDLVISAIGQRPEEMNRPLMPMSR